MTMGNTDAERPRMTNPPFSHYKQRFKILFGEIVLVTSKGQPSKQISSSSKYIIPTRRFYPSRPCLTQTHGRVGTSQITKQRGLVCISFHGAIEKQSGFLSENSYEKWEPYTGAGPKKSLDKTILPRSARPPYRLFPPSFSFSQFQCLVYIHRGFFT